MNKFARAVVVVVVMARIAAFGADVEIVKTGAVKLPIDLAGFTLSGDAEALLFRKTLESDLERSGWFIMAQPGKGTVVVIGSCKAANGKLLARCEANNAATAKNYFSGSFEDDHAKARNLAHTVADRIVWAVKQIPGIASTRIVMIGARQGKRDVYTCDADGKNVVRLTNDGAICIAPHWGAAGKSVVYTSVHGGFPDVYMINLGANTRNRIVGYPGLNTGADMSPDGQHIALTLSKDGNPELYVMRIADRRLTRLTKTKLAAEASPSWAPDGKRIVFVSDRSGSPQLYVINSMGGEERRIAPRGIENVAPDWGPDGRIAWSRKTDGRYHVFVADIENRTEKQATSGDADYEDPSWARDSRHIVCSRTAGYHSELYIIDTMGDPPVRLFDVSGDWHSPEWSRE